MGGVLACCGVEIFSRGWAVRIWLAGSSVGTSSSCLLFDNNPEIEPVRIIPMDSTPDIWRVLSLIITPYNSIIAHIVLNVNIVL